MSAFNSGTEAEQRDDKLGDYASYVSKGVTLLAVVYWGFIAYNVAFSGLSLEQFTIGFLGISLVYYQTMRMPKHIVKLDEGYRDILDLLLLGCSVLFVLYTSVYMWNHTAELSIERITRITNVESVLAFGIVVIVTEAAFRSLGRTLGTIAVVFFIYFFTGPYIPGVLNHPGGDMDQFLLNMVMNLTGGYGEITRIVGQWVAPFILFSGLIRVYDGFALVAKAGKWVSKYLTTGVAQMAVVMSGIIASISPAGGANVAITGPITIPVMREAGISSTKAGAIESVASTAGQITPPVMGASIFIMAGIIGVPLADLIIIAAAPALLYFVCTSVAVRERTIGDITQEETTVDTDIDMENSRFPDLVIVAIVLPSIVLLLLLLTVLRYPIGYTPILASALMVVLGSGYSVLTNRSMSGVRSEITHLLDGFKNSANLIAPLGGGIAAIGMIIQVINITGTPAKVTFFFLEFTGGLLILTLILAFAASILLGLGAPTVAAYIVVAVLIAPILHTNFAIPLVSAHFFVLYSAVLAALTPPLATTVIIAHKISDSPFLATALQSVRIGISLFLLPFVFIAHPEIVARGIFTTNIDVFLTVMMGLIAVTYALNTQHTFSTSDVVNGGVRVATFILGFTVLFAQHRMVVPASLAVLVVGGLLYLLSTQGMLPGPQRDV